MENNKNLESRRTKHSKTLFYILITTGILFVLLMALFSFIFTGWGTDVFSEWREAFLREINIEEDYVIDDDKDTITSTIKIPKDSQKEKEASVKESDDRIRTIGDFFPLKMIIPKIEIELIVNDGYDYETLKKGPGHISVTPLPGDEGRCTISGHRTTYGAPFNRLDEMENGDLIYLETINDKLLTYVVTGMEIVRATDVWILEGTGKKELVLTTCHPKYSAARRLVVIAELLEVFPFEITSES